MADVRFECLGDQLSFGARAFGVTRDALENADTCKQIAQVFEDVGMIVFVDVDQDDELQVAISTIFGELKDHPVAGLKRLDGDRFPGVIEIDSPAGSGGVVSVGGQQLSHWLPWHFDHCYNDELNRAGVLRAKSIVPEGGITGFIDGIALYQAFPDDLRLALEGRDLLYRLDVQYDDMRFGRPVDLEVIRQKPTPEGFADMCRHMPRALHPAIWQRPSGEKVLHISPWMALGIAGDETPKGDALLEQTCQLINQLAGDLCYRHTWQGDEMIIWDNWRMLHSVSGHDPAWGRTMIRTTIKGDYGLGRFETAGQGDALLSETTV